MAAGDPHNDAADFYPDAWIEPGTGTRVAAPASASGRPVEVDAGGPADASRVVVDLRVRRQVAPPTPESIAPYREGLLALEYDVVQVVEGELDLPVIAVAHWVIRDARLVAGAERPGRASCCAWRSSRTTRGRSSRASAWSWRRRT